MLKPDYQFVSFGIPKRLAAQAQQQARELGVTRSEILRRAVKDYLHRESNQKKETQQNGS